ncbi:hypothetical protein RUM43_012211 [Polyplax serrata]|uniref:Uncharacterized protein n=1 Tax=Polyplax serrata TaxID=468196 RepID=A0AAN8S336_POLSC
MSDAFNFGGIFDIWHGSEKRTALARFNGAYSRIYDRLRENPAWLNRPVNPRWQVSASCRCEVDFVFSTFAAATLTEREPIYRVIESEMTEETTSEEFSRLHRVPVAIVYSSDHLQYCRAVVPPPALHVRRSLLPKRVIKL